MSEQRQARHMCPVYELSYDSHGVTCKRCGLRWVLDLRRGYRLVPSTDDARKRAITE